MRISESGIVLRGDSENRGPEADFGPPGAENHHFQNFRPIRIFYFRTVSLFSLLCLPPGVEDYREAPNPRGKRHLIHISTHIHTDMDMCVYQYTYKFWGH